MKIEVKLSPKEFKALLPPTLQEMYDCLVKGMVEQGIYEKEAEGIVAHEMLKALKSGKYGEDKL
jgi:hypothetical protein